MFDGGLNILHLLALIAPHEKHAALDAAFTAEIDAGLHLVEFDATVHRLENPRGPALRAAPNAKTSEVHKQIQHLRVEAVSTRDALKWDTQTSPLHLGRIVA